MNQLSPHEHYKKQGRCSMFVRLNAHIDTPIESVFYPCCWADRRIETLFPQAKITYLDMSASHMHAAPIGENSESHVMPEREFEHEEEYDLVMYSLSGIGLFEETVFPRLKKDGYVIADNGFEAARELYETGKLTLIGCSHRGGWLEPEQCLNFLRPAEHDAEWENTLDFSDAKKLRKALHSKYAQIFWADDPVESMTEWQKRMADQVWEMRQRLHKSGDTEATLAKVMEMPIMRKLALFPSTLPTKQEAIHELFLFRK